MKADNSHIKVINIDHLSVVDNTRYTGRFTLKKMNIRDLAAIGVRKAQLNGGMYHDAENPGRGVDSNTDEFNSMIAHLEIAIKEHPKWWNLDEIADVSLIGVMFKEVMDFENSFLNRQSNEALTNGASEGRSQEAVQETNTSGVAKPMVVKEVQAALEP